MKKATDYSSGMPASGGGGGMGKAHDFTSVNGDSVGGGGGKKAKEYYGSVNQKAPSMGAKHGDAAPRTIGSTVPGITAKSMLPRIGTRQVTLPAGMQMKRRGT